MQSLLLYILVFLLSSYFLSLTVVFESNNKKFFFFIISALFPIGLASLRYGIGTDYFNYVDIYNKICGMSFFEALKNYDFIQVVFSNLMNLLRLGPQSIFFLYSSLTIISVNLIIVDVFCKKDQIFIASSAYLFLFYGASFNTMRQSLAIIVAAGAILAALKKDFKKAIYLTILASLVHISSLIIVPFLAVCWIFEGNKRNKISVLVYMFIGAFIFFAVWIINYYDITIFGRLSVYTSNIKPDFGFGIVITRAPILLLILIFKDVFLCNKNNKTFFAAYIISVILLHLGYLNIYLNRFAEFFSFFLIFLAPCAINMFSIKSKKIAIALIITIIVAYFIYYYYINGHGDIFPYQLILNNY